MAMNNQEREYIEYRPSIRRQVFEIANISEEDEEIDSLLPPIVINQLSKPFSNNIRSMGNILQNLNNLINNINKALSGFELNNVSFSNYDKDSQFKEAFDDYHKNNINRNLKGEVYPILLELKSGINQMNKFLSKELFQMGEINLDDEEEIQRAEKQEINQVSSLAKKIINNQPALTELINLKYQNELSKSCEDLLNVYENIAENIAKLIEFNSKDYFNQDLNTIIDCLSKSDPDIIAQIKKVNELQFNKYNNNVIQAESQINNLTSVEKESIYLTELKNLSEFIKQNEKIIEWADKLKLEIGYSGANLFTDEVLTVLEDSFLEYDGLLKDFYKHIKLKSMHYAELIKSMGKKEMVKQMHSISDDMINYFDFNSPNTMGQINEFIKQFESKEN